MLVFHQMNIAVASSACASVSVARDLISLTSTACLRLDYCIRLRSVVWNTLAVNLYYLQYDCRKHGGDGGVSLLLKYICDIPRLDLKIILDCCSCLRK